MSEMFSLQGRTAIVTGGFSGLGLQFSSALLRAGANVAIAGRRIELGRSAAESLKLNLGERAAALQAFALDVTKRESVDACLAAIRESMGQPTILVNNAGVASTGAALETTEEEWGAVVDVNLSGAWRMAQAFCKHLVADGTPGTIINVGSILGLRVAQQVPAYAASKAALLHLTRAMALELARHSIRINALAPGYFETDLNQSFFESDSGQALIRRVPQRRLGTAADLEGPLLLLASDASSFMTGTVLTVDGGHSINSL